jgi:methionine-rich copper-binding protein CopC
VLRFNERVQLTALTLRDAAGRETRLVLPRDTSPRSEERLAAPALAAGAWRIEWRASSADGHPVRGTGRFTIAPQG